MTETIIRKTTLRYRVWRFTHWWLPDNHYMLRQTNSCKFFWRLVLMLIPATILWVLWEAVVLAAWVVVSIFTVASARGVYTPHFGRWVEFPEVQLFRVGQRKVAVRAFMEGVLILAILAGTVGALTLTLRDSSWSWYEFWEDLKESLRFLLMIFVLVMTYFFLSWLKEKVTDWIHRQKEKVCHIVRFE